MDFTVFIRLRILNDVSVIKVFLKRFQTSDLKKDMQNSMTFISFMLYQQYYVKILTRAHENNLFIPRVNQTYSIK